MAIESSPLTRELDRCSSEIWDALPDASSGIREVSIPVAKLSAYVDVMIDAQEALRSLATPGRDFEAWWKQQDKSAFARRKQDELELGALHSWCKAAYRAALSINAAGHRRYID